MKKALSVILTAVMLLSVMMMSSCGNILGGTKLAPQKNYGEELSDIDGKTPDQILEIVHDNGASIARYDVKYSILEQTSAPVVGATEYGMENIYTYSVDRDMSAITISADADKFLAEHTDLDPLLGNGQAVVYADGTCYLTNGEETVRENVVEFPYYDGLCETYASKAILAVYCGIAGLESDVDLGVDGFEAAEDLILTSKCYRTTDGKYCVVAEARTPTEKGTGNIGTIISFEVYLSADLERIEKMVYDVYLNVVAETRTVETYEFVYEGLEPVIPPEDVNK